MISGTISHYQILEKLGAGGMGVVYKARDLQLERIVALKFLPAEVLVMPGARERFLREARSAAALEHPHIATVFEISEVDEYTFIAMEFVPGETLHARARRDPVTIEQGLDWAIQIADALAGAHEQGIVHRDIKSTNIMITPRGKPVILDFGLAKKLPDAIAVDPLGETQIARDSLTQAGAMVGTVDYLAPELLRGENADARSDIFAFGVVMYEVFTGNAPFAGRTPAAKMNAILQTEPPPLARYADSVPAELERIVRKALAKDRLRRYQTARDLAIDLEELRQSLETEAILQRSGQITPPRRSEPGLDRPSFVSGPVAPTPRSSDVPKWPFRKLAVLGAVGLVAGLLAAFAPPAALRSLSQFPDSPKHMDEMARTRLTERGLSLYGYRSYTGVGSDDGVARFGAFEHLNAADVSALERWRPRVRYETTIASADREDRWELRTARDGHLVSIGHRLRPDHVSATVEAESASALAAGMLAKDFGLDLSQFEALPVAETLVEGRRVREFRWRFADELPRGTQALARVQLSGPDLVDARLLMDLPPATVRAMERDNNVSAIAALLAVAGAALFAIVVAIRRRYFAFPGVRGFLVAGVVTFVAIIASFFDMPETFVREGAWPVVQEALLFLLLFVPFVALVACCVEGFATAVLRAERPALANRFETLVQGRSHRAEWAAAMALGLSLAGILRLADFALHGGLAATGLIRWMPEPSLPRPPRLFYEVLLQLAWNVFFMAILLAAGLAIGVIIQRRTRIGGWIWPLGIAALSAAIASEVGHVLQPWWAAFLLTWLPVSAVTWIALRFGIPTAAWTVAGIAFLSFASSNLPARIPHLRLEAVFALAAWVGLLAWSFWVVRASRSKVEPVV